jgi:alcohol dehydrogenase class IV
MGSRALVVMGKSPDRAAPLMERLIPQNVKVTPFSIAEEPTIERIEQGVKKVADEGCDMIIAFGGGSVIDSGKAIAALATNPGGALNYLEVIGEGETLENPPLPVIAIPTTAGTGSEVTRNAVLASPEHQRKVSLRSPMMLPNLAIIDPQLTHSMPPDLTAQTGMDALTQVIEPFVSNQANPMTDAISREGIRRAGRSLQAAVENDPAAREDMALASLFGGMALANAKLGAVHGFAGVIGGMFPAPHGAVCAILLAPVMLTNMRALHQREPSSEALQKYDEIGYLLTGKAGGNAAVAWVFQLTAALQIPKLSEYDITTDDLPEIVKHSMNASSMKGNPLPLTSQELEETLRAAL